MKIIENTLKNWPDWNWKDRTLFLILVSGITLFLSTISIAIFKIPTIIGASMVLCIIVWLIIEVTTKLLGVVTKNVNLLLVLPFSIWVLIFSFGWQCLITAKFPAISKTLSNIRFPLSGVEQVVNDDEKNIYVYSLFFHRIQKFDRDGNFVTGWFAPAGGSHRLYVKDKTVILIDQGRRNIKLYFDVQGHQIKPSIEPKIVDNEPFVGEYRIRVSAIWGSCVLKNTDHSAYVVVKDPWQLWIMAMPYPAFIFVAVIIFLKLLLRLWVRGKEIHTRTQVSSSTI